MSDRPAIPPLALVTFGFALLIDLIVVTGVARNAFVMMLMLMSNLFACAALYWLILRYFFNRLPGVPEDQSPSRKSSPISE
ncbi:hypothetical protein RGUI_2885 [Rhodovulum sp. P5]|uniref:hypothetical protein n=1 Tax=Rhodovulum sp. P5 TaxID=1564506 RepID=UPI0009C2F236|nr:hypothetical protein [Rhodovulum sp. P5]ARE41026.1 hypothetical protein RGUI_2885 [Rhodovulum sp. P5]